MSRRERKPASKESTVNRGTPKAGTPDALYQAGLRHMHAGRHLDAQVCCQQALAIDAEHADTLHLLGLVFFHARQYDHAVEWISRAIWREPRTHYLTSLGSALVNQGRPEEALKAFDKAVQLNPNDADLWRNLGNVLVDVERPADAILSFQHALKLNPRHWDAAHKSGRLLHQLGRLEEALTYFNLCDELQPEHALTLQLRAMTLYEMKQFEQALADNKRSLALDPKAETFNNTGTVLQSLGRHEEALACFDRALELRPDLVGAINNRAFSLIELRRFNEAFAVYSQSRSVDPGNAQTEWNLALLQMLTGDFEAGWVAREARWKVLFALPSRLSKPLWLGDEPIDGKTVLLHSDEGLGDAIQFSRYVPMIAARGARVILAVEDALYPLLSGLPGVAQCLPKSATGLPAYDFHCPLSSLPLAFKTRLDTIPAEQSYLPLPAADRVEAWKDRLDSHDRLRVGLVWSGNPKHKNDHNRSIPLRMLSGILDLDASFVSLQKEVRVGDKEAFREHGRIVDLTAHLTDFAETAALMSCLDLVITVDTSVAHLAGALGRPTWILLPYTPDYRWLLDREDSPWYPTVRLFRQDQTRNYDGVIGRVKSELIATISGFESDSEPLPGSD